jgi:hypothetical protein
MKIYIAPNAALPIALVTILAGMPAAALEPKPAAAGAMPGDKTMTCHDILAERASINDTVLASAVRKEQAKKTRNRLFGFAKNLATLAVPGAALLAGGTSSFGNLAAQQAGRAGLDAVDSQNTPNRAAGTTEPSENQKARLTRLEAIATLRQCTA